MCQTLEKFVCQQLSHMPSKEVEIQPPTKDTDGTTKATTATSTSLKTVIEPNTPQVGFLKWCNNCRVYK